VLLTMKVRNPLFLSLVLCLGMSALAQSAQSNTAGPAKPQDQPAGSQPKDAQEANPGDPLLDVPPLPKGKVSVVGGTVAKIDQIRNRLVVEPFGGGDKLKLNFDERTHIYRDGTETTQTGIQKGDRVYVDTMLDGAQLFARNIRVHSQAGPADASGQIKDLDVNSGLLTLRDQLSAEPVTFRVDSSTVVKRDNQPVALADVKSGSLATVKFAPGGRARGLVKEIAIIAVPGTSFTFAGKVTHLDLSSRTLAVQNFSDGNTYDITFDPAKIEGKDNLGIGSVVTVVATFTGVGYTAQSITINQETAAQ
jgi:hypothetical protein